jgi:hypothetical protein
MFAGRRGDGKSLTDKLQGAITRLALPLAETSETFAREVLSALLPRAKDQP